MTPSLSVLPALAPTLSLSLDTDPPLALIDDASDRHIKRLHRSTLPRPPLPFGLTALVPAHPTPITVPIPTAHPGDNGSERTLLACRTATTPGQWTGVAIRAIVPLPRRVTNHLGSSTCTSNKNDSPTGASASTGPEKDTVGLPRSTAMRFPHYIWDDDDDDDDDKGGDATDSSAENGVDVELGEDGEDGSGPCARARCCSYESITATEGLSARSFEELRVECYAQSLIARGTKPPPVVQPSLAIPPAFVPRIVRRN